MRRHALRFLAGLVMALVYVGAAKLLAWIPPHGISDAEPLGYFALLLLALQQADRWVP